MYKFAKRTLDIVLSAIALVVLLPLFIILWAVIRLSNKGPAVFKQERAGKNATPFTFYKFRTMRTDVDPFGPSPKSGEDARLTKAGKFLREYSLDELPQLVNVLKGNMSIVGPRPLYVAQIAEWNDRQKRRLLVKPGLTGLAQISGRGELTREEKLEFDSQYVDKANFWLDIKIIFITIAQVFGKKSIYEKKYSQTEDTRGDKSSKS
jgi:undecaprenyl phosphate N,N'-diacetylbacillosamine 1-phosphate transferase